MRIIRLPLPGVACVTDPVDSSPGHKQDAETLYGSQQSATGNQGKLSGEGSHFAHAKDPVHTQSGESALPRCVHYPARSQQRH